MSSVFLYKGEETPFGCMGWNPQTLPVAVMSHPTVSVQSLSRHHSTRSVRNGGQVNRLTKEKRGKGDHISRLIPVGKF